MPEKDFMAQIHKNNRNTISLCLLALLCAVIFGGITSRLIANSIFLVSQASDKLAQGDLNQKVESSRIFEVDTLATSFNYMATQLKDSFTTLEQKNEKLRIAEENYRSIFENALEGIFQSSPQGYYISVNPALAKMYGYNSPGEMIASITDIGQQIYVDPKKRLEFKSKMREERHGKKF